MPFGNRPSDQLPKWQPWTLERIITLLGSLAGIAALLYVYFQIDKTSASTKYELIIALLAGLCILLFAYIFVTSWKKLHRYAQAVFYVHFINHIIRNEIGSLNHGKSINLAEVLQSIADATAECFAVLSARRCRCSILEINMTDMTAKAVVRDRLSAMQFSESSNHAHAIAANTDFSDLWYGRNGHPRYFASKNLIALWRAGRYRNSSFAIYGDPKVWPLPGITVVRKWTLPYRAALVLPIRFIPSGCNWPLLTQKDYEETPVSSRPFVYGFLCVDCRSRNAFDELYMPELGGAIADAIFTFLYAARQNVARHSPSVDENQCNVSTSALSGPQSPVGSPEPPPGAGR